MYMLVAIEITSLLRNRMSRKAWHAVHLLAYFVFATSTVHMLSAGTDVKAIIASGIAVLVATLVVFGSAAMTCGVVTRSVRTPRAGPAPRDGRHDATPTEHATADEQRGDHDEGRREVMTLHDDPQRDADDHGHDPRDHDVLERHRRPEKAGDDPPITRRPRTARAPGRNPPHPASS
jgi:hypothetical protein